MRGPQRLALSVIVVPVFVALLGGSITARAMGGLPEWQERDAAELHSAPWLLCTFGPDTAAGIPAGMRWDWKNRQFRQASEIQIRSPGVVIFDDENRRAGFLDVNKGEDGLFSVKQTEDVRGMDVRVFRDSLLTAVRFEQSSPLAGFTQAMFVISYLRTADGRFTAIAQVFPLRLFSLDIDPIYVPGACATTAEEVLKTAIDAARAKWLAEPIAKPDVPPEAEPPPMPEDHKAEP